MDKLKTLISRISKIPYGSRIYFSILILIVIGSLFISYRKESVSNKNTIRSYECAWENDTENYRSIILLKTDDEKVLYYAKEDRMQLTAETDLIITEEMKKALYGGISGQGIKKDATINKKGWYITRLEIDLENVDLSVLKNNLIISDYKNNQVTIEHMKKDIQNNGYSCSLL